MIVKQMQKLLVWEIRSFEKSHKDRQGQAKMWACVWPNPHSDTLQFTLIPASFLPGIIEKSAIPH